MSKRVAVWPIISKQRKSHLKGTETQLAQPWETLKPDLSFDSDSNASSSKGSMKSESIEKPLFVLADWAMRFLLTLYHVLFCSKKPFHEFSKGSAFAATVQKVLDIVHPGNIYVITTQSKIYTMVQFLFLCLIHSLITQFNCRHTIRSLKNGPILAFTLYI